MGHRKQRVLSTAPAHLPPFPAPTCLDVTRCSHLRALKTFPARCWEAARCPSRQGHLPLAWGELTINAIRTTLSLMSVSTHIVKNLEVGFGPDRAGVGPQSPSHVTSLNSKSSTSEKDGESSRGLFWRAGENSKKGTRAQYVKPGGAAAACGEAVPEEVAALAPQLCLVSAQDRNRGGCWCS